MTKIFFGYKVSGASVNVTPGILALTLTLFAPTVTATGNVNVTPAPATLTLTTYAPTVDAPVAGVYSLQLVATTDPSASPLRIYLGPTGGTMAFKIYTA